MGTGDHIEIEIKLLTPDLIDVAGRLEQAGARRLRPRTYEYNVRYDDAAGDLTGRGIVLRLRRDDRVTLTYKERTLLELPGFATRYEIETEVADFDAVDAILRNLGYHQAVVYEKYREIYQLGGTEIALDETPIGNFTEIEGPPDAVEAVVKALGLNNAPRFTISYLELFTRVKETLDLHLGDLTFENFAGMDVPTDALLGGR